MFIAYIATGIASGLFAVILAFFSGAGFLMSLGAYMIAGIMGTVAAMLWMPFPQRAPHTKQSVTQLN